MSDYRIRLNSTSSINATNVDNFVDLHLRNTTKIMPYTSIKDTVNQRETYQSERDKCNKYRLIVTINPVCTNVLFNALTEIVKDPETQDRIVIFDGMRDFTENESKTLFSKACGEKKPNRVHMIRNTEYSNAVNGFTYYPGYDIFNNHLLRNKSFKLVCPKDNSGNSIDIEGKDAFNTIHDTMRNSVGKIIPFVKRQTIDKVNIYRPGSGSSSGGSTITRHLYINDDIYSYVDSINANLTEDNGWFGFTNVSSINSMKQKTGDNKINDGHLLWDNMDISKVINTSKNCEFIDMYPDRTLFSFNPKYNSYTHLPEYNWHIALTYPYKNFDEHLLIKNINGDKKTNGIRIKSIEKQTGISANDILMFNTYCKHGLQANEYIYIYYSSDNGETYTRSVIPYNIYSIGNLQHNNEEYCFYFNNCNFADEIGGVENLGNYVYRFRHYVNGQESNYYFRIFKKLPNFKSQKELLTEEIVENNFEDFLKNNGNAYISLDENGKGVMRPFDNEQYKLAFASNVYGDNLTQITFTDSIDIEHLKDNLGRPLTEMYVTVIKNNKGYKEWYEDNNFNSVNIEYSHCFGKLTSGVMLNNKYQNDRERETSGEMSDIHLLNNLRLYKSKGIIEDEDITINDNEFIGDLIEHIPCEAREKTLNEVYYRFNTAQREENSANSPFRVFKYDEIVQDDFDLDNFKIVTYDNERDGSYKVNDTMLKPWQRPEGYYYKPHYKIQLREFGEINQDAHHDIRVKRATPIQQNGIFIQITTPIRSRVSEGDVIYISDDANDTIYNTSVVSVIDQFNFIIKNVSGINWITLCDILNDTKSTKRFKLRRKNTIIPSFAQKVGNNTYLWRNVRKVGNYFNTETPDYPFVNGNFYITSNINFFLKRQDSDGTAGLFCKNGFPNDISGNTQNLGNYIYNDEETYSC